jgi:hypothetical protein
VWACGRGYIAGNAQFLQTSGGREERIGVSACGRGYIAGNAQFLPTSGGLEERIGVSACGRVGVAISLVVRNFYKPQEA